MNHTKTYYPSYPLNQFVSLIWVSESTNYKIQAEHYAPLFTELIFNFGDSFIVTGQNIDVFNLENCNHIISGLKTEPFNTMISGKNMNIGLILKPFCYGMISKRDSKKNIQKLSDVLFEQFFMLKNTNLDIVNKELSRLFNDFKLDHDLLNFEKYLNNSLSESKTIKDFNSTISISQKSFIQKFKKHFLITPSEYLKLKQVNRAIWRLENENVNNLTNLGLDCGFYDQSHFIRIFKRYCGQTPTQFSKKVNSVQF